MRGTFILFLLIASCWRTPAQKNDFFQIEVVDSETGRGVPLVELKTVNQVSFWTDSNGIIAFNEPGMMGQEVYFHIRSDGYNYPEDFFKNRGVKLKPRAGGHEKIKLSRINIAERLYRVTGQGIYRDSILTGRGALIREPLLNGQVTGQDTVIVTRYRGKLFWFWGDTDRLSYPLGNFAVTGGTSELPGKGGLDPSVGVDITYFTNKDGFAKQMCPNFGKGLHWIEGVFTVNDPSGRERLVARVSSQEGLKPAYAWHFAVWDDEKEHFISTVKWDVRDGHDSSHPFRAKVNGHEFIYLYPNQRVLANWHSITNLAEYESFSADQKKWVKGAPRPKMNRGSVAWNEFRKRWVMISVRKAGEIWYSEAKAPTGPWTEGIQVVNHAAYNFYNPTQHPYFDQDGGRVIYFEGTYTAEFSAAKEKTPRYNYNQIMYRLDLSDERLKMPEDSTTPSAEESVTPL